MKILVSADNLVLTFYDIHFIKYKYLWIHLVIRVKKKTIKIIIILEAVIKFIKTV